MEAISHRSTHRWVIKSEIEERDTRETVIGFSPYVGRASRIPPQHRAYFLDSEYGYRSRCVIGYDDSLVVFVGNRILGHRHAHSPSGYRTRAYILVERRLPDGFAGFDAALLTWQNNTIDAVKGSYVDAQAIKHAFTRLNAL